MTPARRQILGIGLGSLAAAATVAPLTAILGSQVQLAAAPPTGLRPLAAPDLPPLAVEAPKQIIDDIRRAFVHNLHTGETLNAVYYENGAYVPGALHAAMKVLRDWRSGQEHFMDPRLFDLLHQLRSKMDVRGAFQIVSGYRSAATNAMMHQHSQEVAVHSQHILGKALDIGMEGVELARLHRAALSLRAGGVGFYPNSGFVHVDVGPVRQWAEA
jgi:uncharacterized protein YcbK (DUF882 family)